jgi:hypothetical protein
VTLGIAANYHFGQGGATPYLHYDTTYRYQIVARHGRDAATYTREIQCPIKTFDTENKPQIVLTERLVSIRDDEVTYKIDFSFAGTQGTVLQDFIVESVYDPTKVQNAATSDDILIAKTPSTLAASSLVTDTASAAPLHILRWDIDDASSPGALNTNAKGSLIFVVNELSGLPQCTFIEHKSKAYGIAVNGETINEEISNKVTHLFDSENVGPGFLITKRGDIHSNASICFSKAPQGTFYVGDYLVSAVGAIVTDAVLTPQKFSRLHGGGAASYVRSPVFTLDRKPGQLGFVNIDYSDLYNRAGDPSKGVVVTGECRIQDFFADPMNIQLNSKVYRCKAGAGSNDYNNDEVVNNGDLVVNRAMVIKNGGAGTIVVDGNLYIEDDMSYEDTSTLGDVRDLAVLGWIVRGSIYLKEYKIDDVPDCNPTPPSNWCATYNIIATVDPDGIAASGDEYQDLAFGPVVLGPTNIVGTFFAEGKIYTGKINPPLTVKGSLIADDVKFERLGTLP